MPNPEDILDLTTAMNMTLVLMAKQFKLNYSTTTREFHQTLVIGRLYSRNAEYQIGYNAGQVARDQNGYNAMHNVVNQVGQNIVQNPGIQNVGNQNGLIIVPGIANSNVNGNVVAARSKGNGNGNNGNQIRCYNCRGLGHYARIYIIEEVNANCILMANLQQASTSGTQTDKALVYDSDGSVVVAKFVRDFKSIAKEADKSLDKITVLENENERLLRAVVSHDIMSIVQSPSVVETSDLQTKLEHTKERFENCIIKKENEYAKLWNDWYKKCNECKYDKILYDKAYNNMKHQIECLQAQLGDLKGKSMDTQCASDTLDPLSQKLEDENVSLEFQDLNYAKENAHLKTTYKNLFDSINMTRAQTKRITDSLQDKLNDTIYENAKLRAQLFDRFLNKRTPPKYSRCQSDSLKGDNAGASKTSGTTTNGFQILTLSWQFMGTVRFRNDHGTAILGYYDLQWGNILIARVYYVEGLGHNLFSGKSKTTPHKPKPVPNSKQRLHLLHMDLYGIMRVESINGKRYVLAEAIATAALCYLKNDHEDIGKLGAKCDIGFFIVQNPGFKEWLLNNALTYAPSTITSQKPTKHELDRLFEAMYDDYIHGQPSDAIRTVLIALTNQNCQILNASTTNAYSAPTPTNLSSQAINTPNTS
ncbi:hypothetical protein Tco_0829264 [Tanacetum coccineum]